MKNYLEKIDNFLLPYLAKEGYVLIKTEFVEEDMTWYLRAYIDLKEKTEDKEGVAIEDCVKVSRRLSNWLDKEDFIKEAYTLEVCSPGFLRECENETSEEGSSESL